MVIMANDPLLNFTKKYRSAINSKSREFRMSVEEAGELLSYIARNNIEFQDLSNKIDLILERLNNNHNSTDDYMDGGRF